MVIKVGTCVWLTLLPTGAEAKAESTNPPQSILLCCFVLLTPKTLCGLGRLAGCKSRKMGGEL